jgi:hypothetical protein
MKMIFMALSAAMLLSGCAGVRVSKTEIATGATNPRAIYIRPFDVSYTDFTGKHSGGVGERPIRESLAPAEFAEALKEELEKIAPARVLREDETPKLGWLVEGELEVVNAGHAGLRAISGPTPLGQSRIVAHVRVIDLDAHRYAVVDAKDVASTERHVVRPSHGNVIYEFDLSGGSRMSGPRGSIYAPGIGYATPFDYKNAAERVLMALSPDPHHYGLRTSPTIR